jgi:arylsulfatase A-like enzyme
MIFRCNSISFASIAAVSLLNTAISSADATPKAVRPNILLILTDDQGWGDLGIHGNPVLQTPNLDRLAGEGVEFTQFYVSPVCSLTRASLLTGRHPLRTGCVDTRMGRDTLGRNEITVGQLLSQSGYATALFGKWHQGRYMPDHPNQRGFAEYFGFWQYGHIERYFHPDRLWRNKERVECRGHITDLLTDAAIDFISRPRDEPFFCYVAYNVPHAPFQPPDDYLKRYLDRGVPLREAQIYALIEHCDANIGRLLESLDKQGLRDNTVVLFFSDNGGIHKHFTAGLRGSKGTMYEGGLLSPLLVRYPGCFPSGVKVAAMSDVIDLTPTLCELAGAKLPIDRHIDGHSQLPLLKNGGEKVRTNTCITIGAPIAVEASKIASWFAIGSSSW